MPERKQFIILEAMQLAHALCVPRGVDGFKYFRLRAPLALEVSRRSAARQGPRGRNPSDEVLQQCWRNFLADEQAIAVHCPDDDFGLPRKIRDPWKISHDFWSILKGIGCAQQDTALAKKPKTQIGEIGPSKGKVDIQRDIDEDEDYGLCRNCGYRCSSPILDKSCAQCQSPLQQPLQSDPKKDIMSPPRNKRTISKSSRQTGKHTSKPSRNLNQAKESAAKGKTVKAPNGEQSVDDLVEANVDVESPSIQAPSEETRTSTGTGSLSSTNGIRM